MSIGGLFAGESMFYRPDIGRDASKVALVALVELLRRAGTEGRLLDVQWLTPHLASLGAVELLREEYLRRLEVACSCCRLTGPATEPADHNGPMPEMPEVESLARFLTEKCGGTRLPASISSPSAHSRPTIRRCLQLHGLEMESVTRRGKFLDISAQGLHLVFHLARAGWLRWRDFFLMPHLSRAGVRLPCGYGRTIPRALTSQRPELSASSPSMSTDPLSIPTCDLGPDPLSDEFDQPALAGLLAKGWTGTVEGVLKDQRTIAGIGNAYLTRSCMRLPSPFKPSNCSPMPSLGTLFAAIMQGLADAIQRADGLAAKDLKGEKKSGLRGARA